MGKDKKDKSLTDMLRRTCKAKDCKEPISVDVFCDAHYRGKRRFVGQNIKGDV